MPKEIKEIDIEPVLPRAALIFQEGLKSFEEILSKVKDSEITTLTERDKDSGKEVEKITPVKEE